MNYGNDSMQNFYAPKKRLDYGDMEPADGQYTQRRPFPSRHYEFGDNPPNDGAVPRKYLKSEKGPEITQNKYYGEQFIDSGFRENLPFGGVKPHSHNKENLLLAASKRSRVLGSGVELTMEEGELLLQLWEKNHFIDFNSWAQNAKAKVGLLNNPS